eukprot:7325781-Heterocapsa_arctica.AAC.1
MAENLKKKPASVDAANAKLPKKSRTSSPSTARPSSTPSPTPSPKAKAKASPKAKAAAKAKAVRFDLKAPTPDSSAAVQ